MNSRILIVDDDPVAIQVLYKAVEGAAEICFAAGGGEALALMAESPVDLVLLDAKMLDMDGFATCKALKHAHPEVAVIFVTAASDFFSEIRALESGAVDFISKPINPPIVRARVETQLKLKAQSDLLRSLVLSDPLTGIANRRALEEYTALEWRRALRNGYPLALLMIDIDDFKAYNDYYGHVEGDTCLRKVAQVIAGSVFRVGDLAARYGGEEFAVLLSGNTLEQAAVVAERICQAVRNLAIPHVRSRAAHHVTVSIGIGGGLPHLENDRTIESDERSVSNVNRGLLSVRNLFDRADQALYVAKAGGRNRVSL